MSAPPRVSIIIPNFNYRRFLPERMRSIFSQTCRGAEVFFLDDASTDGSVEFVRSLRSPFPLHILANDVNGGSPFRQWQRGLDAAQGELVWIAEADDSCQPDFLETLMAAAARHPSAGIVYAQSEIIDGDGRRLGSFLDDTDEIDRVRWRRDHFTAGREEAARFLVLRNTIPNASACLFRREALVDADLPSMALRICGDWMTYARICERHDVAFVAKPLNLFRRHGGTVRTRASRDGSLLAETYATQTYIADRFGVDPATLGAARRSTYRMLQYLVRSGRGTRTWVDDDGLLEQAARFDPRIRERLAGTGQCLGEAGFACSGERDVRISGHSLSPWDWRSVRMGGCRGTDAVIPLEGAGLIALRGFRARDLTTGELLWTAANAEGQRAIELAGSSHRVGSGTVLEIFIWGSGATLRVPLPAAATAQNPWELEFEARLGAFSALERVGLPDGPKRRQSALFILPHLELGGADRFNLDLLRQLSRRLSWTVTVVTTRPAADPWADEFALDAADVFRLPALLSAAEWPRFFRTLFANRRPDVLFLSNSLAGYRLLPWLKGAWPSLAVVDLVHMVSPGWRSGGYPRLSIEHQRQLTFTVAVSRHLRDWLVEHGREADQTKVCQLHVDTRVWRRTDAMAEQARTRWLIEAGRPVLLFAARFHEQKNPQVLPALVKGLIARGHNILLLLAGDGPERGWLERNLVAQFPWHCRMIGPVAPHEMPILMAIADLLILPSRSEGIALVLYEALAMGVVPVATEVGGQRELVNMDCGILVPPARGLAEVLVAKVDLLLNDPQLRRDMSRRGRVRMERMHSLEGMGDRMHDILVDAIEASKQRPKARGAEIADEFAIALIERTLAEEAREEVWTERRNEGRPMPGIVSALARWARKAPGIGRVASRVEERYGDKLGRLIARWM